MSDVDSVILNCSGVDSVAGFVFDVNSELRIAPGVKFDFRLATGVDSDPKIISCLGSNVSCVDSKSESAFDLDSEVGILLDDVAEVKLGLIISGIDSEFISGVYSDVKKMTFVGFVLSKKLCVDSGIGVTYGIDSEAEVTPSVGSRAEV